MSWRDYTKLYRDLIFITFIVVVGMMSYNKGIYTGRESMCLEDESVFYNSLSSSYVCVDSKNTGYYTGDEEVNYEVQFFINGSRK